MLAPEWHPIDESYGWPALAFRPHGRQKLCKPAMNRADSDATLATAGRR